MIYHYKGFFGCDSQCDIELHRHKDFDVIVATEISSNEGTSITNMAEQLATLVCKAFDIVPARLVWIEHYPERPIGTRESFKESFDLVNFTRNGDQFLSPRWSPLDKAEAIAITKGKPPEPRPLDERWAIFGKGELND